MTRSSTATPAPRIMPHSRCFGGNVRQAIAMTTALSPDRMIFTKMICRTAIQNGACVMSCHRKSTAEVLYADAPSPDAADLRCDHQIAAALLSADDFVASEKL